MTNPGLALQGLLVPTIPAGQRPLRPVAHRRHRRIDHDAVLQLLDARGKDAAAPRYLRYVRGDVAVAYIFTAMFGLSIMLIANRAFFLPA